MKKHTVTVLGIRINLEIYKNASKVAKAVRKRDSAESHEELYGCYQFVDGEHFLMFSQKHLTARLVVHESVHIALSNLPTPDIDFGENLANSTESVYAAIVQQLRAREYLT